MAEAVPTAVLGVALLVKLLLQPAHLALLTFYRRLRLEALVLYLGSYYCLFVPVFLFFFYTYVICLVGPVWVFFLGTLLALAATLGQGAAGGVDVRVTFAYSTAINLSLLVLVVGLGL